MKMFYVYKKEWCSYMENRGYVVITDNWQRAKGIAMAQGYWVGEPKDNIIVEEIKDFKEGILCATDGIRCDTRYN